MTAPRGAYVTWRCPDCEDWGCGGTNPDGVAYSARLHRLQHDGLTFGEAMRQASESPCYGPDGCQEPVETALRHHALARWLTLTGQWCQECSCREDGLLVPWPCVYQQMTAKDEEQR